MPTREHTIEALTSIANGAVSYAVAFHVLLALGFIVWGAGLQLKRRVAVSLASLPLASVSVFASKYEVVFNAAVFALLAFALLALGLRSRSTWRAQASLPRAFVGGVLLACGWVYPHFLDASHSPLEYLYASPLGLLPCPTLAFLIGLSLTAGVPGGRSSARVLAGAGLFYGAWGVLKLGVWLDGLLLLGALVLLIATRSSQHQAPSQPGAAAPYTPH